jgi:hypothetical protein
MFAGMSVVYTKSTIVRESCCAAASVRRRAASGYTGRLSSERSNIVECQVSWTGAAGARSGMGFVAETGSGPRHCHGWRARRGPPRQGGQNLAPRPMETVLAGAGGCTAYDVVLILQRGRHDVRGCSVR